MKFSTKQTNNGLGTEKQISSCIGNSMEKTILMLNVYIKLPLKLAGKMQIIYIKIKISKKKIQACLKCKLISEPGVFKSCD